MYRRENEVNMEKEDLIKSSPAFYFNQATGAALKDGEMGLIAARKGMGKTSVLVQFGLDSLLRDKNLVHVSFDQESSNVISWYSSILSEITKKQNVNKAAVSEEIMKKRMIFNFNQENFSLLKVVVNLKVLKSCGICIDTVVVDGLDFGKTKNEDVKTFSDFIKSEKMTAWFSCTTEADNPGEIMNKEKLSCFKTVCNLHEDSDKILLTVLQNGKGSVTLNSRTLLMSE